LNFVNLHLQLLIFGRCRWWTLFLKQLHKLWSRAESLRNQQSMSFYGTQIFITVFTRARHWSLS